MKKLGTKGEIAILLFILCLFTVLLIRQQELSSRKRFGGHRDARISESCGAAIFETYCA